MKPWKAFLSASIVVVTIIVASACVTGGEEGDRCNPLVHRDECDKGLVCRAASCSISYCCPPSGPSSEPNCQNLAGCVEEAVDAAVDAGPDDGG